MRTQREAYFFMLILKDRKGESWVSLKDNKGISSEKHFYAGVRLRKGNICLPMPPAYWEAAARACMTVLPRSVCPVTDRKIVLEILEDAIK